MALKITVEDLTTGEKGETTVPDGSYIVITDAPCYLDGTQMYAKTHVLTIKGIKNGLPRLNAHPATRSGG